MSEFRPEFGLLEFESCVVLVLSLGVVGEGKEKGCRGLFNATEGGLGVTDSTGQALDVPGSSGNGLGRFASAVWLTNELSQAFLPKMPLLAVGALRGVDGGETNLGFKGVRGVDDVEVGAVLS